MKFIEHCKQLAKSGLQLKNLKSFPTRDGEAWSCTVYLNGKKLGAVDDAGHGGGLSIDLSTEDQKAVVEAIKASGYAPNLEFNGILLDAPKNDYGFLEWALSDLSAAATELKSIKRKAKNSLLLVLKGAEEGEYQQYKAPYTPDFADKVRAKLGDKIDFIINEEIADL